MNREKWHPGKKHKESSLLLYWQNFQKQNSLWIRNSICTAKNFYLLSFKNASNGWKGGGQVFNPCRILLLSLSHASRDFPPWQQCFSPGNPWLDTSHLQKKKVIFLLCLVLIPSAQNLPHFQQRQPQCWPFLTGLNLPQRAESQTHSSRDTNPLDFSAVAHNPCREQTKNHKHRQHRGTQADGGGIMRAVKFKPNPSLPSLCWLPALPLP